MSDTSPYPRRTVDAVLAAVSGGIAGVVLTLLTAGIINATTINATSVSTATLHATSTAFMESAQVTSTLSVAGTAYAENAFVTSTLEVAGQAAFAGSVIRQGSESLSTIYGASSLDFAALVDGTCEDKTITVTGVAVSTTNPWLLTVGMDDGFRGSVPSSTLSAYVSGSNTVTLKNCANGGDTLNPNDYVFTVRAEQMQSDD